MPMSGFSVANPRAHGLSGFLLQFDTHVLHEELHVFPDLLLGGWVAKQVRRMIGAHDLDAVIVEKTAPQFADGLSFIEQILGCHRSPADNVLRCHDMDLSIQKFATVGGLLWQGIAIAGWPTSQNIADVDVFSFEMAGFNDLIQKLSGRSHKGLPGSIFFRPRCFAYEHNVSVRITNAEHSLLTFGGQVSAALASGDNSFEAAQGIVFFVNGTECFRSDRFHFVEVSWLIGGGLQLIGRNECRCWPSRP